MTILHLSDTHGMHRKLCDMPHADVLVHSGDFTLAGGDMEALDFIEWLAQFFFPPAAKSGKSNELFPGAGRGLIS